MTSDILTIVEGILGYYQSRVSVRQTITYGNASGQFKYFGFYKALFDFLIAPPPVAPNLVFLGQSIKTGKYQVAFQFDNGFEKRVDLTPKEYETYLAIAQRSYSNKPGLPVGTDRGLKPVISHIKSKITNGVPDLTYSEQYKPERCGNAYIIRLDRKKVFVRKLNLEKDGEPHDIPITDF